MMMGNMLASGGSARRSGRRRIKLFAALAVLLSLLSMLAGAALAAYRYGVL